MRLAVVAIALSATMGAASAQDVIQNLINPYYYCVGRSTGKQPDRFRNPDAAIERAFLDCQTEEMAIRSYAELQNLPPVQINAIIALQRGRLKRSLSEKLRGNSAK